MGGARSKMGEKGKGLGDKSINQQGGGKKPTDQKNENGERNTSAFYWQRKKKGGHLQDRAEKEKNWTYVP